MAERGKGADQVLAFDASRGHQPALLGRLREAALAHQARLSGAQARGGARRLRRKRLAWVPPPRHDVNRGLWVPNLREGSFSPLKTCCQNSLRGICPSRRLQTQRLRHCGLSATSRIPLPPCADGLSPSSSPFSRAARAAERKRRGVHVVIYDTVVLDAEAVIPLNGKLGRYRPPSSKVCDNMDYVPAAFPL